MAVATIASDIMREVRKAYVSELISTYVMYNVEKYESTKSEDQLRSILEEKKEKRITDLHGIIIKALRMEICSNYATQNKKFIIELFLHYFDILENASTVPNQSLTVCFANGFPDLLSGNFISDFKVFLEVIGFNVDAESKQEYLIIKERTV